MIGEMWDAAIVGWILVGFLLGIGVVLRALGADKPRRRLRVVSAGEWYEALRMGERRGYDVPEPSKADEAIAGARSRWLEHLTRRGGP